MRNRRIALRISNENFEIINHKAKLCHMTMSEYMRKSALEKIIVIKNIDQFKELIFEINKIGTNINQIAKIANTYGYVDDKKIENIEQSLIDIFRMINKL